MSRTNSRARYAPPVARTYDVGELRALEHRNTATRGRFAELVDCVSPSPRFERSPRGECLIVRWMAMSLNNAMRSRISRVEKAHRADEPIWHAFFRSASSSARLCAFVR